MRLNRRDLVKTGIAGISAGMAGCLGGDGGAGGDGGSSGGEMSDTIALYGNDAMEDTAVGQAFTDQTGISFNSTVGVGAQPISRFLEEQEADQESPDLLMTRPAYFGTVIDQGLAVEVDDIDWSGTYSDSMTEGLSDIFGDDATSIYPTWEEPRLISWNPNTVNEPIEQYEDLLRDEFENEIITLSYLVAESFATLETLWDRERAEEFYLDLDERGLNYPSSDPEQEINSLVSEQAKVLLHTFSGPVPAKDEGQPIEFVVPESGTSTFVYGLVRVGDAPHPDAADEFLRWITSEDGIEVIQGYRAGGVRPAAAGGSFGNDQLSQWDSEGRMYPQLMSNDQANMYNEHVSELLGI